MTGWHDRPPDWHGDAGEAWDVHADLLEWIRAAAPPDRQWRPDWDAGVCTIVAHVPGAAPAWSWYTMLGIHLRPIPGETRPAHKQFPAATHELLVMACDPNNGDPPRFPFKYLRPHNIAAQVVCVEDTVFVEAVRFGAQRVVEGRVGIEPPFGPDSFSQEWAGALRDTIEHLVTGGHP